MKILYRSRFSGAEGDAGDHGDYGLGLPRRTRMQSRGWVSFIRQPPASDLLPRCGPGKDCRAHRDYCGSKRMRVCLASSRRRPWLGLDLYLGTWAAPESAGAAKVTKGA